MEALQMVKLRYKITILSVLLLSVFLYGRCNKAKPVVKPLPLEDKEQIVIDPVKHKLIVITPSGPKVSTLPDRESTIDIKKDGTIKVTSSQLGIEARPFAGIFYSNGLRYGAGVDGFYFKKLDIGIGLAGGSGLN